MPRVPALIRAGVLVASSSPALTPKPTPAPPVFGAGLEVMSLPVFVTDKSGKAVPGLTAEDFEVQDEGRPAKVVGFHEIDAAQPLPQVGLTFRGAAAARRQFLLLFDLSFTSPSGLVRSRTAAADFVRKQLGPSDLASVATFSVRSGVKVLIGFTSDRAQVERAIEGLGVGDVDRKADPLGLTYTGVSPTSAPGAAADVSPRDRSGLIQDEARENQVLFARSEAGDYRRKIAILTKGLDQLARMLDVIQGRKQVIYLSAGFEQTALTGETGDQAKASSEAVIAGRTWEVQSDARFGDSSVRNQMDEMLRSFAGSDVVVHTVDVTGLAARGDASQAGRDAAPGAGRESLNQIAQGTGGQFVKDANNLGQAFGEILAATQHYYVLAVEPGAPKGPGRFHKLKVRVRGSGRDASARAGYFEVDPATAKRAAGIQSAEAIVKGISGGEIGVSAVAVPYRSADGKITLPVAVEVDGPSLLARGAGGTLALQIYGYALDADGRVEDIVALAPTLDLAKVGAKLKDSGLQVHTAFTLAPGPHSLRFLVADGEKGRRGFRSLDVIVPGFEAGTMLVAPALFMDDPARWLVVQSPSRGTPTLDLPFRVETDLFAPRVQPRLANGRTDSVCVLAYDGGAKYAAGTQFAISAQLLNGDGTAVRIGKLALAKSVAEADGFRRFVLNVTPSDVPPGDYSFKVKVKDPASGNTVESVEPIHVE